MVRLHKGWFRLWIVLATIGTLAIAESSFLYMSRTWDRVDEATAKRCVDEEFNLPSHPDSFKCGLVNGHAPTVWDHENTTSGRWWPTVLGASFFIVLVITGLLLAVAAIIKWIGRGFKNQRAQ